MKFKYLIAILLLSFMFVSSVDASTTIYPRDPEKNYGVNKHWKITDKNLDNVINAPLVDASEKVYDFANILTDEEELEIYNDILEYRNLAQMDLVILTINMPYNYDDEVDNYAVDFYDYNDFGIDFSKYSGTILIRNAYEEDPYFNVVMFGEAQLYYDYYRRESMLDSLMAFFPRKDYLNGLKSFVKECTYYYNSGIPSSMDDYFLDEDGMLIKNYHPPILIALGISTVATVIILSIYIKRNKMVKPEKKAYDYFDKNSTNFTERVDNFVRSHTTSYTSSSSSGGSGGGGSSRGSSGGGHSSGGGRHG